MRGNEADEYQKMLPQVVSVGNVKYINLRNIFCKQIGKF